MLTATSFFVQFKNYLVESNSNKDGARYFDIYKTNEPRFTELVNKRIIHDIIKNSGLHVQHEYFRIDTTGWVGRYEELDEERARKLGLNRHLWDLKVAVEHENDKMDWLDELVKLIHIRCPLKIVISYNHSDRRALDSIKLDYAAECMNKVDAFSTTGTEEYLIVLGNCAPKDKKSEPYKHFDYRGYIYNHNNKKFEAIQCQF